MAPTIHLEMVQNISRNFTDMKLMRDRVVNKTIARNCWINKFIMSMINEITISGVVVKMMMKIFCI